MLYPLTLFVTSPLGLFRLSITFAQTVELIEGYDTISVGTYQTFPLDVYKEAENNLQETVRMADRVGQQLGNYRLVALLGQGGYAKVYL